MKKFYFVETSADYYGTIEYNVFATEQKAIQYIKSKFLTRISHEVIVREKLHTFRSPNDKDFILKEIYYDHELFTPDNVQIEEYGVFDYLTLYTYDYNPKHDGLPRRLSEALTNQGKRYIEVFYATTKDGKFYNGDRYFDSLEELKEFSFRSQSARYSGQFYKN